MGRRVRKDDSHLPYPMRAPFARTRVPDRDGIIYFVVVGGENPGPVKIGFTTRLAERLRKLKIGSPVPLVLLASVEGHASLEREYHERFARERLHGEWFTLSDRIMNEVRRIHAAKDCSIEDE